MLKKSKSKGYFFVKLMLKSKSKGYFFDKLMLKSKSKDHFFDKLMLKSKSKDHFFDKLMLKSRICLSLTSLLSYIEHPQGSVGLKFEPQCFYIIDAAQMKLTNYMNLDKRQQVVLTQFDNLDQMCVTPNLCKEFVQKPETFGYIWISSGKCCLSEFKK